MHQMCGSSHIVHRVVRILDGSILGLCVRWWVARSGTTLLSMDLEELQHSLLLYKVGTGIEFDLCGRCR
jgi:hypothetical protein